jgi:hypothetical protein
LRALALQFGNKIGRVRKEKLLRKTKNKEEFIRSD